MSRRVSFRSLEKKMASALPKKKYPTMSPIFCYKTAAGSCREPSHDYFLILGWGEISSKGKKERKPHIAMRKKGSVGKFGKGVLPDVVAHRRLLNPWKSS